MDITQQEVLVAVGRGIQQQDNLEVAEELAKALGGAVAASRPIVDQGWLPTTRQVGKSGMTVKPKCFFALGISGAPEHVEGDERFGVDHCREHRPQCAASSTWPITAWWPICWTSRRQLPKRSRDDLLILKKVMQTFSSCRHGGL